MIETARDPRAIDTSAYRNDCMARGTDQLDLPGDFEQALFFQKDVLATYLLRPDQFAAVAPQVGALRAEAFLEVSDHGPREQDLDGRDSHYWHLLIWDTASARLAGAQRISFSSWQANDWSGRHSYLEHCYPGLARAFAASDLPYLEVGRVFVAQSHRDDLRILPNLLRAAGMLAQQTGHRYTFGLLSYGHHRHRPEVVEAFVRRLRLPPFRLESPLPIPPPRHPLQLAAASARTEAVDGALICSSYRQLEQHLQGLDPAFRIPGLVRLNASLCHGRVADLSFAQDFNQIFEILMVADTMAAAPGLSHPGLQLPHRRPWLEPLTAGASRPTASPALRQTPSTHVLSGPR